MYDNFFYDHKCTIYSVAMTIVNGAEKKGKTVLYTDIPCAIWAIDSGNSKDTVIGRQGDTATHKINIDGEYSDIGLDMVFVIGDREYTIVDMVAYTDIDDSTDNLSFYVRIR